MNFDRGYSLPRQYSLSNIIRRGSSMLKIKHFTKKCTKCNSIKVFLDFVKSKTGRHGIKSECRICSRKRNKILVSNNIEKEKARKKKIYYQNKEYYNNKSKQWRANNPDKVKAHNKRYFSTEIGKAISKNSHHKRRLAIKNGSISGKELLEIQSNAKVCYWCNVKITKETKVHIDHYIPICNGGEHSKENIVISCSKCNHKKHSKDPIVFANSIGRLL